MEATMKDVQASLDSLAQQIHDAEQTGERGTKTDEILVILGYLTATVEELLEVVRRHDRQINHLHG